MPICGKAGISSLCISSIDVGQSTPLSETERFRTALSAPSGNYLHVVSNSPELSYTHFGWMPSFAAHLPHPRRHRARQLVDFSIY
jgi:hypothetical protein